MSKSVTVATGCFSLRGELRDTLKLAGPIVVNQVGHMSMGMVDTLVAGHISTVALAGLGLAANFYWTFTSVCAGSLLALDTYFSQAAGARDEVSLRRYLQQSFWSAALVMGVSLLLIIAAYLAYMKWATPGPTTTAFGQYIRIIVWTMPSVFPFFVLQRYWQSRQRVMPVTLMIIAANILNLAACTAFGLGRWGFPRMGVRGIAMATVLCRYSMLLAILLFTWVELRPRSLKPARVDWTTQKAFFRLGLPAASHTALEIGAFLIATILVSTLGAAPLAAHHVVLMLASFTFMFPLGFSSAAAVRVGTFIGAGEPEQARRAGWLCITLAVSVMACFALGYLAFPRKLLELFTTDPQVIELGIKLLVLVAIFQIADGTQVSTTGALRGLGNTKAAMFANLIGHYPIGLAAGVILCFGFKQGVVGLWTGLAAGLISVGGILLGVWTRKTRHMASVRRI